jgi:hypothetical protein
LEEVIGLRLTRMNLVGIIWFGTDLVEIRRFGTDWIEFGWNKLVWTYYNRFGWKKLILD